MQKPDALMNSAGWRFDNSYSRLPEPLFTREQPLPVRYAGLTLFNDALAAELGLDAGLLRETGAPIFVGNSSVCMVSDSLNASKASAVLINSRTFPGHA